MVTAGTPTVLSFHLVSPAEQGKLQKQLLCPIPSNFSDLDGVGIGGVAFSDRFSNIQGRRVWANRKDDERGESERTG